MDFTTEIIGTEQWYLLFLGILLHIMARINKAQKTKSIKFSFSYWFRDNWYQTLSSTLLSIACLYMAKDYLSFGEVPLMWRNVLVFTIGYNTDSVVKNFFLNRFNKEISN